MSSFREVSIIGRFTIIRQIISSLPDQSVLPPHAHTTYSFRFGEVHLDKAVVGCIEVMLKNELVSLIGDVLLEQRQHEEGHKEKGTKRGKSGTRRTRRKRREE